MLLERRCVGNVARAHQWIEDALHSRYADIRPIKLFLHDDMIMPIALLQSGNARLAQLTRMIARPHATARQVRNVPVVFHSQWFSSLLHGDR